MLKINDMHLPLKPILQVPVVKQAEAADCQRDKVQNERCQPEEAVADALPKAAHIIW